MKISKYFIIVILFVIGNTQVKALEPLGETQEYYKISKVADGLYFLFLDSTAEKKHITKSTIVEFKDYLVLIEVSLSDHKTSKDTLIDHSEGGEKVIRSLNKYFPKKPLKYVLSSHWHPHSIASVIPFISKGITLVITKNNFVRLSDFVDSATNSKYRKYIRYVDEDSLIMKDKYNSIIAYKIDKDDYTSLPVQDFLYFLLPKYNFLHCSCMYQRFSKNIVDGKEFISPRTADLSKFLKTKKVSPKCLISIDPNWDNGNGLIYADTLNTILRKGILPDDIDNYLMDNISDDKFSNNEQFVKDIINKRIPKYMINKLIYKLLETQDLNKALRLAKTQAMLTPSDPNVWDSLAEVYYFLGEIELAKKYGSECKKIDKEFKGGGEEIWKKDLEGFRKKWQK